MRNSVIRDRKDGPNKSRRTLGCKYDGPANGQPKKSLLHSNRSILVKRDGRKGRKAFSNVYEERDYVHKIYLSPSICIKTKLVIYIYIIYVYV